MDLDLQPTLENATVLLRPLHKEDFDDLYQVAKDPLIWEQHPNSDRYQRNVFETFFQDSLDSLGALVVIDNANNAVIGSSRFNRLAGVDTAVEIGWSFLARAYWGGKYNRAVKSLMLDHAFNSMEHVVFYIGRDNLRSQKAVEKIGGILVSGFPHQNLIKNDSATLTYLISRETWKNFSAEQ